VIFWRKYQGDLGVQELSGLFTPGRVLTSQSTSSAKKRSVQVQISIRHAVYREALGHCRPAGGAVDFADTADRIDGCIDTVDQEAGHARVDQLGHRSTVGGDDRRAAGERLHNR